jgi:SAM-dependent methyltransferase
MSRERWVERFYGWGVERYGGFHANYLNFGLWTAGVTDFVAAAETLLARVATLSGLDADAVLLDVACGMGTQDRFFAERFGCRSIDAIDLTAKHIAIARAKHALPGIRYHVGDACRLPFDDGVFSHVIAVEGIVNFNTRARFLREARRVLRADGRLGISDFVLQRPPRNALERQLLRLTTAAWQVPADNVTDLGGYVRTLEAAGFADVVAELASDDVIPGYVAEQTRGEVRRAMYAIRGPVVGRLSTVLDHFVYRLWRAGVLGYVFVGARVAAQRSEAA